VTLASSAGARRVARTAAAVIAILVAGWSLADIVVSAIYLSNVSHVSGAWMVLARDLAEGTLYRPLFDPEIGYGGTRFMPVFFCLHAVLIRLGVPAIPGGIALSLASGAALLWAVAALLRLRGASALTTLLAIAVLLSLERFREGFTSVRGDVLPVAFAIWGVYAFLRSSSTGRTHVAGLALSGFLFSLAFLTKITSLFGLASVVVAALIAPLTEGRSARDAVLTLVFFLVFAASGAVVVQLLSHGVFLENFRVSAAGGVDDLTPWTVLRGGLGGLKWELESNQIGFMLLFVAGTFLVLFHAWRRVRGRLRPATILPDLEPLLFVVSGAGTMIILSSPGAGSNHLVDLMVAAVLLIPVHAPLLARTVTHASAVSLLLLIAVVGLTGNLSVPLERTDRRPEYRALADEISHADLVLAEDPSILIHTGKPARMLDSFMLRVIRANDVEVAEHFDAEIRSRVYDAVLLYDAPTPAALDYLNRMHFGPGFRDTVDRLYTRGRVVASTIVYQQGNR